MLRIPKIRLNFAAQFLKLVGLEFFQSGASKSERMAE